MIEAVPNTPLEIDGPVFRMAELAGMPQEY
jgi:hypothetical protein